MPGPTLKPRRAARDRHFELGGRQVTSRGLEVSYLADLYHQSMTVSWPVFFAGFAVVFLTLNLGFATLYWLGTAPIANAHPGSVSDLFFFSIETLATVGYGDMHPQTVYGHLVATVEIFTGMASLAVMGGLVFSRFSRPRAALLFSNAAVIGLHQGALTLMARLANARHDLIEASSVNLWFSRLETTRENTPFRRFQKLTLERSENPLFSLSWTIFHKIDDDSPLNGVSADELTRDDIMVLVTFAGVDASSGQTVYARKRYGAADIRWNHSFVDILNYDDSGRLVFDYTGFHDSRPQDGDTP